LKTFRIPFALHSCAAALAFTWLPSSASAAVNVLLTDVPDYTWYAGCFGTATGNLMGYWDRHGFPNFYTGPTGGGLAPLTSNGPNVGIRSMWASRAGFDGRPANQPGHIDDYWLFYADDISYSYESTAPDPYTTAGRQEHAPDSIGDFIGLSQKKWANLNGECDGNIDGFSFVFWNSSGEKRVNYVPRGGDGEIIPDIPSGLKAWTEYRGSKAEVFSQLTDFNPQTTPGLGFTFEDLRQEIDAGYPVLLFLQKFDQLSRSFDGFPQGNPELHGMLAYGYYVSDAGDQFVRYKTSWGSSGDLSMSRWAPTPVIPNLPLNLRGVIGYRPLPNITSIVPGPNGVHLEWQGPSSVLSNMVTRTSTPLHRYVVEKATSLNPPNFEAVSEPSTARSIDLPNCCPEKAVFFRLRIVPPEE
jgi:hypothetical protein